MVLHKHVGDNGWGGGRSDHIKLRKTIAFKDKSNCCFHNTFTGIFSDQWKLPNVTLIHKQNINN